MNTRKLLIGLFAVALIAPACRLLAADEQAPNTLSDDEKKAGWTLLFDGKTTEGWKSYGKTTLNPNWKVEDGTLCHKVNAGDISTTKEFDSFEFQMDYKIGVKGNSGIMFHVNEGRGAAWATGPEVQLEDNATADDPVRCGWIYALYQPPNDPKTGKPLDATKPTMQWNHIRVLVTPKKGEIEVNGVKYFEFVKGSDDWNARVAKSKFARMPGFGKYDKGYLVIQGDHPGELYMKNIKIRTVAAE